jgi:hypothetical protein
MTGRLFAHVRRQWIGVLALFLVLTGGTAVALDGHNTVFSDDIAPGQVRSSDLATWTRPHALLLDQIGNDSYSDRHLIGGIGTIQLWGRCINDNEAGYGFPAFDLSMTSSRAVEIGYAFQQNMGSLIQGEATIGAHGGGASILHIEGGAGGNALADGQIAVRDGDRTMTFILHTAADHTTGRCRASGTVTRAAP